MSTHEYERPTTGRASTGNQTDRSARLPQGYTANGFDDIVGADCATTEAALVKQKILGFTGDPPRRFVWQTNQVLVHTSPDARKLLWEDEEFWQIAFFAENPGAADTLLRSLDPVVGLQLTLQAGRFNRWSQEDALGEVQAWARERGAHSERALASAGLLDELRRSLWNQGYLARAIELLLHQGDLPSDPLARLRRALDEREEEVFLSAWDEATTDASTLKELASDAAFLGEVEARFSGAVFAIVQRCLLADTSVLSKDDAAKLEGVIVQAVRSLDVLARFWVPDAAVIGALETMNGRVEVVFPEDSEEQLLGRKHHVRREVVSRLESYIKGQYPDSSLEQRLTRGLSGANLDKAKALLEAPDLSVGSSDGLTSQEAWASQAEPLARQCAGALSAVLGGWFVRSGSVKGVFDEAQRDMQGLALGHVPDLATALGLAHSGMAMIRRAYDEQFGSLVDALHQGVSDRAIREHCLHMISAKADGTSAVLVQAAIGLDGDGSEPAEARLETAQALAAAQSTVRRLAHELDLACSRRAPKQAQRVAAEVGALSAPDRAGGSVLSKEQTLSLFAQAFGPMGGSIEHRVVESLPVQAAQEVFDHLGLRASASQIAAGAAAEGLTEEQVSARHRVVEDANELFRDLERGLSPHIAIDRVNLYHSYLKAYQSALGPDAQDIYYETNGITLVRHLGLKVRRRDVREELEAMIGEPIPALLKTTRGEAQEKELRVDYDLFAVGSTFDLETARKRAMSIKNDIDNSKNTIFELSKNGNREELRVVVEVFEELYGYNPLFAIKEARAKGQLNGAEHDLAMERLKDAGQASFGQRLVEMAKARDFDAVYEVAFKASAAERAALLEDGRLLADLRRHLSERQWERVWESLNGTLTLGEALRTRQGWLWGMGTDDKGMKADIAMLSEREKALATAGVDASYRDEEQGKLQEAEGPDVDEDSITRIKEELKKIQQSKSDEVDQRFTLRMRELWADQEARAILSRELSGADLLTMQQLILRGGSQTGTDKAWAEAARWGNDKDIIGYVKEMTDKEREAKRRDPRFLAMLSERLYGSYLAEALAILHSNKGEENALGVDKAIGGSMTDGQALFASISAMSTAELLALAGDQRRLTQIRGRLREGDLQRFDQTLEEIKKLGDKDLRPQVESEGEQGSDWTDAAREQERSRLILTHTLAIREGVHRGKDYLLAALQAVYNEKGEITPVASDPTRKEHLFTAGVRRKVDQAASPAVSEVYGVGSQLHSLTVHAILGKADPSTARLEAALRGYWDNMDNARAALSGVSDHELIHRWSNVVREGEDGRSLKGVYEAYKAERDALQGEEPTAEEAHRIEAMHYRYVDFPLDVARNLVDIITRRSGGWLFEYTTTRAQLEMKQIVRTRLLSLPSIDIAKAIGVEGASDLEALKEQDPEQAAEVQAEVDTANGTDRQARSMHAHLRAVGAHQMSARSLADSFTYTDEQMSMYYSHYAGAYGAATERQESDESLFGQVTAAEKAEMEARAERFNVSVNDYKAAKSKVAEVMKWIAIAAIGAASAAFTGPAGPTLLVSLLTAGATATASVAIDGLVQGNDYDVATEGVQKIVTDVGMAAITFGLAKGWDLAAKNYRLPGAIDSAIKAVTEQEKQIADALKKAGFVPDAMWAMGKAGLMVPITELKGAAVASLDLSELKYGWRQGLTHGDKTLRASLDGMPAKMQDAILKALIDTGFAHLKEKVYPKKKKNSGVPGIDEEDPVPKTRSDGEVVSDAFQETLSARKLQEAAFDQAASVASGHIITLSNGKRVNLTAADGVAFLETYIKGRLGGFVKKLGEEAGTERSNRIIAAKAAELSSESTFQGLNQDEQLAALKLYVHVLKEEGSFGGLELTEGEIKLSEFGQSPAAFMAGRWKEVDEAIGKAVPSTGLGERDAGVEAEFREWVLSDPSEVDQRIKTDFSVFSARLATARERADSLKDPKLLSRLNTTEEQLFYLAYVSDPKRLMDFSTGKIDNSMDLSTDDGLRSFQKAVQTSKHAIAGSLLPELEGRAADKAAFEEWFKASGHEDVVFDPLDAGANKARLQRLLDVHRGEAEVAVDEMVEFQRSVLLQPTH
ncbi:MAG: hypothetical protein EA397_05565 [Deltaproteobacteria bacterium]|nr:MAG: hypothetical protein EA397_05565 [Deltaproteobacteria bacterium]